MSAFKVVKARRGRPKKEPKVEISNWDSNVPDFFYERLSPKSRKEPDNLGMELLAYDQKHKPLILSKFFSERLRPIILSDVKEWCARPEGEGLKRAVDLVRQRIQSRREEGAINFKLHSGIFAMKDPLYDPEYKAYKVELETKKNENNKVFNITMPVIDTPKDDNER